MSVDECVICRIPTFSPCLFLRTVFRGFLDFVAVTFHYIERQVKQFLLVQHISKLIFVIVYSNCHVVVNNCIQAYSVLYSRFTICIITWKGIKYGSPYVVRTLDYREWQMELNVWFALCNLILIRGIFHSTFLSAYHTAQEVTGNMRQSEMSKECYFSL